MMAAFGWAGERATTLVEEGVTDARMRVVKVAELAAPREEVWALMADHEEWPQWYAGFSQVEYRGESEGEDFIGAHRSCRASGMRIEDEIVIWEEPSRMVYRMVPESSQGPAEAFVVSICLEELEASRCLVRFEVYFETKPYSLLGLGMPVMTRRIHQKTVENLVKRFGGSVMEVEK